MLDWIFGTSYGTPYQLTKIAKNYESLTYQERIDMLTEAMEIEYDSLAKETVGTSVYRKKYKNLSIEYIDDII